MQEVDIGENNTAALYVIDDDKSIVWRLEEAKTFSE